VVTSGRGRFGTPSKPSSDMPRRFTLSEPLRFCLFLRSLGGTEAEVWYKSFHTSYYKKYLIHFKASGSENRHTKNMMTPYMVYWQKRGMPKVNLFDQGDTMQKEDLRALRPVRGEASDRWTWTPSDSMTEPFSCSNCCQISAGALGRRQDAPIHGKSVVTDHVHWLVGWLVR
jgi:hypothetical protein